MGHLQTWKLLKDPSSAQVIGCISKKQSPKKLPLFWNISSQPIGGFLKDIGKSAILVHQACCNHSIENGILHWRHKGGYDLVIYDHLKATLPETNLHRKSMVGSGEVSLWDSALKNRGEVLVY